MKKIKVLTCVIFILFIFGLSIGSIIAKDRSFSDNENRVLASAPKISSVDSILSGDFQSDLESYLSDQVVLRDQWMTLLTGIEKKTGNTDIGGAYVGKDGYDFEKILPEDVDDAQVAKNTSNVETFFETCSEKISSDKLYFLLVPTAAYVYEEKLPAKAIMFDQEKYIDDIQSKITSGTVVDVRKELVEGKDTQLFYKTDHHWTTDGAAVAAAKWCSLAGKSSDDLLMSRKDKSKVTSEFRGSLYSKILDADSAYDEIWAYETDGVNSLLADGKELGDYYSYDKLEEKDKYAFFFGGNYGELCIDSASDKGKGNLLIIKDSFANTFVPLISGMYDNIYMIDLRYYNGDLGEYLEEHEISEVMVLYNISNFVSDKNLFKLNM